MGGKRGHALPPGPFEKRGLYFRRRKEEETAKTPSTTRRLVLYVWKRRSTVFEREELVFKKLVPWGDKSCRINRPLSKGLDYLYLKKRKPESPTCCERKGSLRTTRS